MNAQIGKDEFGKLTQRWLIFKDWEAAIEIEPSSKRLTDFSGIENTFQFANGILPTPVFVNEERYCPFTARADHFFSGREICRHRLLTDGRNALGRCQFN